MNAFTVTEVTDLTGLSAPMIDYLSREGFLQPAYGNPDRRRGKVRYYSYRDLVIAKVVQGLRDTGVELYRLKEAIQALNSHPKWVELPAEETEQIRWLVSDGSKVFIRNQDGFLDEVSKKQRAFSFIVNLDGVAAELKRKVSKKKRENWSITNTAPKFETVRKRRIR